MFGKLVPMAVMSLFVAGCLGNPADPSPTDPTRLGGKGPGGNATTPGDVLWTAPKDGWQSERWAVAYDNIAGVAGERIIEQPHPLSAGWHLASSAKYDDADVWTMQDEAAGGYHDSEYTFMVSPSIQLAQGSSPKLSFAVRGDAEANDYEGLYWDLSSDAGATWVALGDTAGASSAARKDWTPVEHDLAGHAGKTIQLRFLFRSDSSCSADTTLPPNDLLACGQGEFLGYFVGGLRIVDA